MRKFVKFLHTFAACGLIGGLLGYLVVLIVAPEATAQAYADKRLVIQGISQYILLPSLGVALVSGLVSMIVHRPFLELRWVWAKALLGFSMFEATLALVLARARSVAEEAVMLASGAGDPAALASMIAYERPSLYAILALSSAQVVLGVWRPGLRRPLKSEPSPSNP